METNYPNLVDNGQVKRYYVLIATKCVEWFTPPLMNIALSNKQSAVSLSGMTDTLLHPATHVTQRSHF